MAHSLRNATATPNISASSLTTTAPSTLQDTRILWHVPRPGPLLAQVKELPEVPHSSLPATVPKFPSRGAGENGVYSGPVLSYSQDLGSIGVLELRLHIAPTTAACSTLRTQPERTPQNGKNNWVIHCQCIC